MTKAKLIRRAMMDLLHNVALNHYGEKNVRRSGDNDLLVKFPQPDGGPIYVEIQLKLPT
jgi:hypothetical protein